MLFIKNGHIKPMVGVDLPCGDLLIGDDGKILEIGKKAQEESKLNVGDYILFDCNFMLGWYNLVGITLGKSKFNIELTRLVVPLHIDILICHRNSASAPLCTAIDKTQTHFFLARQHLINTQDITIEDMGKIGAKAVTTARLRFEELPDCTRKFDHGHIQSNRLIYKLFVQAVAR